MGLFVDIKDRILQHLICQGIKLNHAILQHHRTASFPRTVQKLQTITSLVAVRWDLDHNPSLGFWVVWPNRLSRQSRIDKVRGSNPSLGVCLVKKSKLGIHEHTTMRQHNIITNILTKVSEGLLTGSRCLHLKVVPCVRQPRPGLML